MLLHYLSVCMKAYGRCGGQYSGSILVGYPKVLYIGSMTGAQWLVGGSIDRAQRVGIFNFRVYRVRVLLKTSGSGRVSGIFAKKIINRVFSGIENLDRVFSGTS